jgi:hypothetical protein
MQVAAAVVVVVAVAVVAEGGAFNGGGSVRRRRRWGLRIGDDEATMEIYISGGGWQQRVSVFDSGDG